MPGIERHNDNRRVITPTKGPEAGIVGIMRINAVFSKRVQWGFMFPRLVFA